VLSCLFSSSTVYTYVIDCYDRKMADLLCEELLLLEDDMKLVSSLQLPEDKEDPYKSNAGK
jgi:hypothetical protein